MKMIESSQLQQSFKQPGPGTICIRREWPQLGRALYDLEQDIIDTYPHLTEQQKVEYWNKIRETILEQCHTYEQQYEAFEFVKRGRAVAIVGNPHYQGKDGKEYELPYTGLEGC